MYVNNLGIKRSKDRQNPTNEAANHRLYAVCDLTLALIMSKTANFGLREVPQVRKYPNKKRLSPLNMPLFYRNFLY